MSRYQQVGFGAYIEALDALGAPRVVEGTGALLGALQPRVLYAIQTRPASAIFIDFPRVDEVLSTSETHVIVRDLLRNRRESLSRTMLFDVQRAYVWQLEGPRTRMRRFARPVLGGYYQLLDGRVLLARGSRANMSWTSIPTTSMALVPLVPRVVRRYQLHELEAELRERARAHPAR